MSNEWIKIALLMNFGLSDVQNIKKKCGDDPKKCCTEIFERWLSAGRKWENLLPILKEVLDSETFENIEGKLENIEKAHGMHVNYWLIVCTSTRIHVFTDCMLFIGVSVHA